MCDQHPLPCSEGGLVSSRIVQWCMYSTPMHIPACMYVQLYNCTVPCTVPLSAVVLHLDWLLNYTGELIIAPEVLFHTIILKKIV